ncbi:MAG: SRPBCC domain-containing protein [Phycisphaerales bacterium]|nr:SRPBCC domain-containing protein [Phycisphaerales bacterium]
MNAAREVPNTDDRVIVLTREYDAPRALVWKAWTDPKHLARWWGPAGFSTTTRHMDVRPGGQWRYVMHGPDGTDYENLIAYIEVVEPERLVYRHGGDVGTEPVHFSVVAKFDNVGPARTRVTLRMEFETADERARVVREYNAIEGGKQTLGRLAEYLEVTSHAAGSAPFVISRHVRAPRDLVYRAWTQRDHLMKWLGPKGVSIPECSLDLRPGGVFLYAMRGPDGSTTWGKWVFREIVPGERLVFVVSFADESGATVRAPFDEAWPLEMLSVVTFVDHAGIGGGTVITVQWSALNASADEQRTFDRGHASMNQGWSGTFESLVRYLASIQG